MYYIYTIYIYILNWLSSPWSTSLSMQNSVMLTRTTSYTSFKHSRPGTWAQWQGSSLTLCFHSPSYQSFVTYRWIEFTWGGNLQKMPRDCSWPGRLSYDELHAQVLEELWLARSMVGISKIDYGSRRCVTNSWTSTSSAPISNYWTVFCWVTTACTEVGLDTLLRHWAWSHLGTRLAGRGEGFSGELLVCRFRLGRYLSLWLTNLSWLARLVLSTLKQTIRTLGCQGVNWLLTSQEAGTSVAAA